MIPDVLASLRDHLTATGERSALRSGRASVVQMSTLYRGRAVYAVFTGDPAPAYVVKVESEAGRHERLRREWDALTTLASEPRLVSRVPRPVAMLELPGRLALVQSAVGGRLMSVRLRRRIVPHPRAVGRDLLMLGEWAGLLASLDVAATTTLDPDDVAADLDRACTGSAVPAGAVSRLARLAARTGPVELPLVRIHGDLNTTNYLVHRGRINVVDWEGGLPRATPLVEMFTALLQYGQGIPAVGRRLPSLLDSVHRSFTSTHWLRSASDRTWDVAVERLGLPVELAPYLRLATLVQIVTATDDRSTWRRPTWAPVLHHLLST